MAEPMPPIPTPPSQETFRLPFAAVMGLLLLIWSSSVYTSFGISAYPRQEWLVEALVGAIFILPALNLLKGLSQLGTAVRIVGGALILHSLWDALHWPGAALIQTPVDSWLPRTCPFLDLPVGFWLLLRGR